eukprot:SAG31_NODE_238_length_19470_cov_8.921532_7_plen_82_part_00
MRCLKRVGEAISLNMFLTLDQFAAVNIGFMFSTLSATGFEGFVQDPMKIMITVIVADNAEVCVDCYYEFMVSAHMRCSQVR